jgi:hypothetical protein
MSRESNDGHVCPACDTVIYREECACEPAPAKTIEPPAFPSPLLAKHKLDVSWDELT